MKAREFTKPKHGVARTIALTDPARERLRNLPRESEFVFTTLRRPHYRPSSRRTTGTASAAALGSATSTSTWRRGTTSGCYAWNVLELDPRDIALHFGHHDGGELVRKLCGHPDAARARERLREAFRKALPMSIPFVAAAR